MDHLKIKQIYPNLENFHNITIRTDNYSLVETFFLQTQYNKVFKYQELLYKPFKTKNIGIKTKYIAYHDLDFFFVIYFSYVNMSIVNKEIFFLVPQFMDQGILKNIFINHMSQILEKISKKKNERYFNLSL